MYGENDSREGLVQPYAQAQAYPSAIPQASHGQAGQGANAQAASTAQAEEPPFYKRRWFIISSLVGVFLGIPLLFIILFPVLKVIAQGIVNKAALNIQTAAIQVPQNATFQLHMEAIVTHTGIFNAKIEFTEPMNVTWIDQDDSGNERPVHLGFMSMDPLYAQGSQKRAYINSTSTFNITDEDAFGEFTAAMITRQNFTWRLQSDNLNVQAMAFPTAKGIYFNKDVVLTGINGFNGQVALQDFRLPSDAPNGSGINFSATTGLENTSPFQVNLGTCVFGLSYKGVELGQGKGENVVLVPGNNAITLNGVLISHKDNSQDLTVLGDLFTKYLNGEEAPVIAKGISTQQVDGTVISWLSHGLQALTLNVPFKAPAAIDSIKAINVPYMNLTFTEDTAWSPSVSSQGVQANMILPFGFNVAIGQIQNTFNITQNGKAIASLSTPLGKSTSDVKVINDHTTQGTINITIDNSPLIIPSDVSSHDLFSDFNKALTLGNRTDLRLVGYAHAVANMSIGNIVLDPIKFDVPNFLKGLGGLKGSTTIAAVDVMGGTTEALTLSIDVSIYNPSNLILNTGDLVTQLYRDGGYIGTTLLPKLVLNMGNNTIKAIGSFQPNASPAGAQTLSDFVGKKDVAIAIKGYEKSTNVSSLKDAFNALSMDATLPGLKSDLLQSASLTVLSTTGVQDSIAHVQVKMTNPFTADLQITSIQSNVSAHGINLGSIESTTKFTSQGKSTINSPDMDLAMNLDPSSIFSLLRALAVDGGMSTEQIDGIMELGGISRIQTTKKFKRANVFTGFDLPSFVDAAFKNLVSDVALTAGVTIGEYATTLSYTQKHVITITDQSLHLLLPVLAKPIVQKVVDGAILGINTVLISDPAQQSFKVHLNGGITKAGPFDAVIKFTNGLAIKWNGKTLGTMQMPDVQLAGDVGATLNVEGNFQVADVNTLEAFSEALLTTESFVWEISATNLTVSAMGIDVTGTSMTKSVTLKALNSLKGGVKINAFDLPSNDPAGGIHLTLNTTVTNPSQVGMDLSTIGFRTFFGSTFLGPVSSTGSFTLAPLSTSNLQLTGRLVPQTTAGGLADVSTVFNNFIHGKDSNVAVQGDSAGPSDVTWLNNAIKKLQIATILPNQGVLSIIKAITMDEMTLMFTPGTAYSPASSSHAATAAFTLPFAFPIDITGLGQNITTGYQGTDFAELQMPMGPVTTDVQNRIIHLTFSNVPFGVFSGREGVFQQFLADTTTSKSETFHLSGHANAVANTAVGTITLTGVAFSVDTTIAGLQGLNAKSAVVSNLDVNHGYPDYLLIKVTTTLYNPSNLTIGTGDVSFGLEFASQTIGSAAINGMTIVPGTANYSTDVHYSPHGDAAMEAGRTMLQNFLQGIVSSTKIQGSQDTTVVDSLKLAMSEIALQADIPALHQQLITGTTIVFPPNIAQSGVAQATTDLNNPFTASLNILALTAHAYYHGLNIGNIDRFDASSQPIHAGGHSTITTPTLPLKFNLDPLVIIQMLSTASQEAGVDIGPLQQMFQLVLQNPTNHPNITATVASGDSGCHSGAQFDVNSAILKSLAGLKVDLAVDTTLKLDDYQTDLSFNQTNVPVHTDATALNLISVVAPPVVQKLVDGASLVFSESDIADITEQGFSLSLKGAMTGTGPLDALIEFPEPVVVNWQGTDIATLVLPGVCAAANVGVPDYNSNAQLTITNIEAFTQFSIYMLHNESFDWKISTTALRVTALGIKFDGVTLSKTITLKAFNGLPGVTISNFQLPSDDPAGGIHIETDSTIPSPAQLGIALGSVTFQSYFGPTLVGPLFSNSMTLVPRATTKVHLAGHIVPQKDDDLKNIGALFTNFLQGKNQTLTVKGDSVNPGNGVVSWLSTAFKTIELQVVLPGQKFDIIKGISIGNLQTLVTEQNQAYNPPTSSSYTVAQYANPFGFSLQVVHASETIKISSNGVDVASLDIPALDVTGPPSTGNTVDMVLHFSNVPLASKNNAAFEAFFAAVTLNGHADFTLGGSADVIARTSIGDVPIAAIPFSVPSSLNGINDFGGNVGLANVKITGSGGSGGNQFILGTLNSQLTNPSNISLGTNDVSLGVSYQGTYIGRAAISNFDLKPGDNSIPSEFHYMPNDANDTIAQSFLTRYLTSGDNIPLTIHGDTQSTSYGSLSQAMQGVSLQGSLTGINANPILTHVNAYITAGSIFSSEIEVDFDVKNPLDVDLQITHVQSDSGVNGDTYAQFSQDFSNFIIPAGGTANSGKFGHVRLTKGALGSLAIIPLGHLDVSSAITLTVGIGGYKIPSMKLISPTVPTSYHVNLF